MIIYFLKVQLEIIRILAINNLWIIQNNNYKYKEDYFPVIINKLFINL